jgi:glycosyltransferase involved in cell wall biosynthesis
MADRHKLRVVMIIQSYLPRLGGAEKQLAAVCVELRKRGIEPVILTRRYSGMRSFEVIDQTPVYRTPAPKIKPLAAICYVLFGLLRIFQLNPDVYHAHELLSPSDLAILAKKYFKKPVVVKILRGGKLGDLDKLHHRKTGPSRIRRLKNYVDIFLAISPEIARELAAEGIEEQRCRFLPNGVDINVYQPVSGAEKAALRRELDLPDGFLCVYSGRLAPEKGLLSLVNAWQAIVKKNSRAYLLVLGSGEMEKDLRRAAGDNVLFLGLVEETKPYYQCADAFILPSETEGLSNSMLEAMACALPVIATKVGAALDLIRHQENGWLIRVGNTEDIVEAVEFLIDHPKHCTSIGNNAMEIVRRDYSLEQTVSRLIEVYEDLSGRSL